MCTQRIIACPRSKCHALNNVNEAHRIAEQEGPDSTLGSYTVTYSQPLGEEPTSFEQWIFCDWAARQVDEVPCNLLTYAARKDLGRVCTEEEVKKMRRGGKDVYCKRCDGWFTVAEEGREG
jgi:uncharacterized protein YbaR (Trm112 family)